MAYNLNKSPQPFGGSASKPGGGSGAGKPAPSVGSPVPCAPRISSSLAADNPVQHHGPVTRRQLLSPAPMSPQASPCPSPVTRLRPHSIALSGSTTFAADTASPTTGGPSLRSQGNIRRQATFFAPYFKVTFVL